MRSRWPDNSGEDQLRRTVQRQAYSTALDLRGSGAPDLAYGTLSLCCGGISINYPLTQSALVAL